MHLGPIQKTTLRLERVDEKLAESLINWYIAPRDSNGNPLPEKHTKISMIFTKRKRG